MKNAILASFLLVLFTFSGVSVASERQSPQLLQLLTAMHDGDENIAESLIGSIYATKRDTDGNEQLVKQAASDFLWQAEYCDIHSVQGGWITLNKRRRAHYNIRLACDFYNNGSISDVLMFSLTAVDGKFDIVSSGRSRLPPVEEM